jgi:hypothetical protein
MYIRRRSYVVKPWLRGLTDFFGNRGGLTGAALVLLTTVTLSFPYTLINSYMIEHKRVPLATLY